MTVEEVRRVLFDAAKVHMPAVFAIDEGQLAKVAKLEEYLNLTACIRGELEEARLHTHEALSRLMAEWDDIEGWEMQLGARRTQDDIRRAKKLIRPELHDGIRTAKHLVARLSEQIRRLENDDAATSRLYTMVTGS